MDFNKKLKPCNKLFMKQKIKPKIMNVGVKSWKMREKKYLMNCNER